MSKRDLLIAALIAVFVTLLTLQINQPPFERFPNWDQVWSGPLVAGKLIAMKQALLEGMYPALNPYVGLGWNMAGDTTAPMSPVCLPNLLIFLFDPETTISLRTAIFLFLGCAGAFFYLRRITGDALLSVCGAICMFSLPFVISIPYHSINAMFYMAPFYLLLIHTIIERPGAWHYVGFVALSMFSISAGDVHAVIMFPAISGTYAFLVGLWHFKNRFGVAFGHALCLSILSFMSGFFYIIPLVHNLHEISIAGKCMQEAGLIEPAHEMTVFASLYRFMWFFNTYCVQTLFKPIEGSGVLLYTPLFAGLAIMAAVAVRWKARARARASLSVPLVLVITGMMMFVLSLLFYALPGLASSGHGTLRYHINLLPFMVFLAAVICIGELGRSGRNGMWAAGVILLIALAVDGLLFLSSITSDGNPMFAVRHVVSNPGFSSSNRVPVRFLDDMWRVIPLMNLAAVVFLFVVAFRHKRTAAPARDSLLVLCAMLITLFSISVHNELRATQQSGWQILGRNPYHLENYRKRSLWVQGLLGPADPDYRVLPVSADVFRMARGRNWKFIADTELQVVNRRKVLFSYRETMSPYAGLLYSSFGVGYKSSNWFPPLTAQAVHNLGIIKLMGVRWVLSADREIADDRFRFLGAYDSPDCPFNETAADGPIYAYELLDCLPVTFVTGRDEEADRLSSLVDLISRADYPWLRGVVRVEPVPGVLAGAGDKFGEEKPIETVSGNVAGIVAETYGTIDVDAETTAGGFVVLSRLFRPFWQASVDGEPAVIRRAYGGLMCVRVPPGRHTVRFEYVPYDVVLGFAGTAIALLLPLVVGALLNIRSRRTRGICVTACVAIIVVAALVCGRQDGKAVADGLFMQGRYGDAAGVYDRLVDAGSGSSDMYASLGMCREALREWKDACCAYEKVVANQPDNASAWNRLGWMRYRLREFAEASNAFDRALSLEPIPDGLYGRGMVACATGRYRDAEADFSRWIERAPDCPKPHVCLAFAMLLAGDGPEKILSEINTARAANLESWPELMAQALWCEGAALCRMERFNEAIGSARAALRLRSLRKSYLPHCVYSAVSEAYAQALKLMMHGVTRDLLLKCDFGMIEKKDGRTLVHNQYGPAVVLEGKICTTNGPALESDAVIVSRGTQPTRIYGPASSICLSTGAVVITAALRPGSTTYSSLMSIRGSDMSQVIYIYHDGKTGQMNAVVNGKHVGAFELGPADGDWKHYVVTWDHDNFNLYVNGEKCLSSSFTCPATEITRFAVGWLGDGDSEQWDGCIEKIMSFGTRLSEEQCMALYLLQSLECLETRQRLPIDDPRPKNLK